MLRWITSLYALQANQDTAEHYIRWFIVTFGLVLAVVFLASLSFSFNGPAWLSFVGLAVLVGATGFAAGGFLGFLFGVPRVGAPSSDTSAPADGAGQPTVRSNTNLEEVSDWLTKIVVGVSLVQFGKINGALLQFSAEFQRSIPKVPNGGFAACLVLVGSAICGFLSAYLKSRTNLLQGFNAAFQIARKTIDSVGQSSFAAEARKIIQYPLLTPDAAVRTAAANLLTTTPPGANDAQTLRLIGFAQAILKNFKGAAQALSEASKSDPDNDLKVLAARASAIAGDGKAGELLLPNADAASNNPLSSQDFEIELSRMVIALYSKDSEDRQRAVDIGERLEQDPSGISSPRLWLYLCSAYGQLYTYLKNIGFQEDRLPTLRQKTLNAIDKALALDPRNNLPILQMLWQVHYPGKPKEENDLEVFEGDPDFAKRLDVSAAT